MAQEFKVITHLNAEQVVGLKHLAEADGRSQSGYIAHLITRAIRASAHEASVADQAGQNTDGSGVEWGKSGVVA